MIGDDEIALIRNTLSSIESFSEREANARAVESIGYLHEIRNSIGIVLDWSQKIIAQQTGGNFESQLEKADINIQNLFRSINLLQEQTNLCDVIANPAAITYGAKCSYNLAGFVYKLVKLFEPRGAQKGCQIRKNGTGNIDVFTFNSFKLLPLILIDNAIKYSIPGREIVVDLDDVDDKIIFSVFS